MTMTGWTVGGRGVLAATFALPLSLLLIGTGGGLIFDPLTPWAQMGTPTWVLVAWGFVELALLVAIWIPYLHRIAGAVGVVDALFQAWAYAGAGRTGYVVMYCIMAAMGGAIALLWSSAPVALVEARQRWQAHSARAA